MAIGVFKDVQDFMAAHRDCGALKACAQPPTAEGYRLWVACPCGDVLERYVTPESAHYDLVHSSLLALPN